MVSAAELNQAYADSDVSSSKTVANGLLLGCIADLASGILSFMVNGKEVPFKVQVETGTKLYPAIFIEPTAKEMFQFELGRIKNCLPLSSALFPNLGKQVISRCPPRLKLQYLKPLRWSRVPNTNLKVHTLKMNNVLGWSLLCEDPVNIEAVHIPEEDRWINILELNENKRVLEFYHALISLYEAVCAQSNNYVAHQICKEIDERQFMYCIQNPYLSGQLRMGFHDLLIKLHLNAFVISRSMTKHEYVVPLNKQIFENNLDRHDFLKCNREFPSPSEIVSVRPSVMSEDEVKHENQKLLLIPPVFDLNSLKQYVINSFTESIRMCSNHIRDPIGGSKSTLFVPLIKLIDKLLIMGVFDETDLQLFMSLLDPKIFKPVQGVNLTDEGLLKMKIEEEIKYELCNFLHSICDYVLRYRIEAIVSFSSEFVSRIQTDQKKRYIELKESNLPSAIMAKKTKEFRCPASDQMQSIVRFKSEESASIDLPHEITSKLSEFHEKLNKLNQIKERIEDDESQNDKNASKNIITEVFKVLFVSQYSDRNLDNEQFEKINEENNISNELSIINSLIIPENTDSKLFLFF
jgi:ryanodine receptor 2